MIVIDWRCKKFCTDIVSKLIAKYNGIW
jgi:hypothetical protein